MRGRGFVCCCALLPGRLPRSLLHTTPPLSPTRPGSPQLCGPPLLRAVPRCCCLILSHSCWPTPLLSFRSPIPTPTLLLPSRSARHFPSSTILTHRSHRSSPAGLLTPPTPASLFPPTLISSLSSFVGGIAEFLFSLFPPPFPFVSPYLQANSILFRRARARLNL